MKQTVRVKLTALILEKAALKFESNKEYADACNVDESIIRDLKKGEYNFSINIFEKFAFGLEEKMSTLLIEIDH